MNSDDKEFEEFKKGFWKIVNTFENYAEKDGVCQQKSSDLSIQVRNEGNELFRKKNHDDKVHQSILSLYTKSIALAIENSEEQALGYSNRSVLLMHIEKYKKSLIDINKACSITKSADLKKKLLLRKEKCLLFVKDEDNEKKRKKRKENNRIPLPTCPQDIAFFVSFMKRQGISDKELKAGLRIPKTGKLDNEEKFNKLKVPEIELPNEKVPCFSESITLKYNEKYGRHVVATRDIKPGEILSIERGLVFPATDKIYLVCSYCLNFTWNGTPCPNCVFAVYCSEKCKLKAWEEYHDIECSILPSLFTKVCYLRPMISEMMTLRLFIMFVKSEGLQNIIDQAESIENNKSSSINELLTNEKFHNKKFKSTFNLPCQAKINKLIKCGKYDGFGALSVKILSKHTAVLNGYKDSNSSVGLDKIKKLISKLKAIIDSNSGSFREFFCDCADFDKCATRCPGIRGMTLEPSNSFYNHSCVENIAQICCKDGRIITYSTLPIKKNEQLLVNYGLRINNPKKERQKVLAEKFNLQCKCEACKNSWLEKPALIEFDPQIEAKIEKEIDKFAKSLLRKKLDYLTLTLAIKKIELSYKYFNNNLHSYMFCHDYVYYLTKFLNVLYGIEANIPKTC